MKASSYPIFDLIQRLGLFAFLWWAISGGAADSWLIGLPVVFVAAYLSVRLKATHTQRIHLIPLTKFIPFFLYKSVCGGMDVARRVFTPRLPIHPAFVMYPLRLPEGAAQVFFTNSISLLPGTFCTHMADHRVQIHVLDRTVSIVNELEVLELKVAGIFGINFNEEKRNETL